ncbi:MAG: hypothetical protein M3R24_01545 [Chloroflexota bacterium]|nr:hypothetical protein [Chloroflexota bacterium]PLS83377.1 MAG: hypothetical protein CYG59_01450 [Chloroflexota bacterium]
MSDQPLFQNTDKEEERYAPQQLPRDDDGGSGVAIVPTTGGAFQPAEVAPGASTETGPVVGAAALAKETEQRGADEQTA